jgi:cytochrome c2
MPLPRQSLLAGTTVAVMIWAIPSPADEARGRLLYENHCQTCHTSVVHVRNQRKAKTPAELRGWIGRWSGELKLGWGETEQSDVYQFLNNRYYKLPVETTPR